VSREKTRNVCSKAYRNLRTYWRRAAENLVSITPRPLSPKVLKEGERTLTDDFIRFSEHYRFEAVFCNVEAGHEKGNVESKVGYHRRNWLVPVPRFERLSDFNQDLLENMRCGRGKDHYRKESTIAELYAADKTALLALRRCRWMSVSTYGKNQRLRRFYLGNGLHEYSVSPQYANSRVLVRSLPVRLYHWIKNHQPHCPSPEIVW